MINKKSEAGLTVLLIIIIAVLFFGWLINIGQRECRSNKDCGSEAYCGSDFSCHTYPNIQKTVAQYHFLAPSIIIGIAIIIAAIIFRWKTNPNEGPKSDVVEYISNNTDEAAVETDEEIIEPYYKNRNSGTNIKTP